MRNRYVVAYDIRDPKRLRRIYNKMRGFGEPLQYSVFFCELSLKEKAIMISDLIEIIHPTQDSIMIINTGWTEDDIRDRVELIGDKPNIQERKAVVV